MYIGRARDIKLFLSLHFVPGCHGECFEKEIVIFNKISFPPKMPLLKKDSLQCPSAVNKNETLTCGRRGNGKPYSAKLCKYTHLH